MRIAEIQHTFRIGIVIGEDRRCAEGEVCASGEQHGIKARRRQLGGGRRVFIISRRGVAGESFDGVLQLVLAGELRCGQRDKILGFEAELAEPLLRMACQPLAEHVIGGDDADLVASGGKRMAEKNIDLLFRQIAEQPASPAGDGGIVRQGKHRHAMGGGNLPRRHHRIGEQGADNDIRLGNHGLARGNTGAFLHRIKYQKLDLAVAK